MNEYVAFFISIIIMPYILTVFCLIYELIRYRKQLSSLKIKGKLTVLWEDLYTGLYLQASLLFTLIFLVVGLIFKIQKLILWLFN